jgi:hypothetical protein
MTSNASELWRDVPTDDLGLNAAASKALADAKLMTAGDISDHPDLAKVPGIGPPSKKAILKAIDDLKAELASELDETEPTVSVKESGSESRPAKATAKLSAEELAEKTDRELADEHLQTIRETAVEETDDGLHRMLARAKMENNYEMQQIVDEEIGRRFEEKRKTQMQFVLGLPFSDLERRGYSTAEEGCRRYVNEKRYRISHEASVALAREFLAMKEGGVKLKSGRRVTHQRHVVEKILELAYVQMKAAESKLPAT